MTPDTTAALRAAFLDFFARRDHRVVKSAPLIPASDPTLMFTNAGMVPFKDCFVGDDKPVHPRVASCQKCMRVSGKHNDLEEVGRTARHQTLFEMLGNFSFGDYFKEEAIALAWELLTSELGLARDRLWVTVFGGAEGFDADDEARALWKKIAGLPDERILSMGLSDNFWAMGDVGPCGPCTEIHFDTIGEAKGGAVALPDFHSGRVVEIWNNVFMQFNRNAQGTLTPLPSPSVDTGMGLERLSAVIQGESSNYHTDLFAPVLSAVESAAQKTYGRTDSEQDVSMRVIADHARATAFLVADGIQPSNEGRGYVLRRIMRRAIRHGHNIEIKEGSFAAICDAVVAGLGDVYVELQEAGELITRVAEVEETGFRRTLSTGLGLLQKEVGGLRSKQQPTLPGATVFRLYDTYGFPPDLTRVLCAEENIDIDEAGFQKEMDSQRQRSRKGEVGESAVAAIYKQLRADLGPLKFCGYPDEDTPPEQRDGSWSRRKVKLSTNDSDSHADEARDYLLRDVEVVAIISDGALVQHVDARDAGECEIVFGETPFYGEAGGQVGDSGVAVSAGDGGDVLLDITTTTRPLDGLPVCQAVVVSGEIAVGDTLSAGYQPATRAGIRAHHSATHLLHHGLRRILGEHAKQSGSFVTVDRLRFDYSHFEAPGQSAICEVERIAALVVASAASVDTEVMDFDAARERGAVALFGEKYGDRVRVVSIGDSTELCGGTHVANSSDIGLVLVLRDEAVSSGIRRIEAECAAAATARLASYQSILNTAVDFFNRVSVAQEDITTNTNFQCSESDSHPVLAAVAKLCGTYAEQVEKLRSQGAKPHLISCKSVHVENNGRQVDLDLESAQHLRSAFRALQRAVNAKPSDADELRRDLADLGAQSPALLAVEMLALNRENAFELSKTRAAGLEQTAAELAARAERAGTVSLLAAQVDGVSGKQLRELGDKVRARLSDAVVCIASPADGRVGLLVSVSKSLTGRLRAGDLVRQLAPIVGGKGGGKPELAQGGGDDPSKIPELLTAFRQIVDEVAG